MARLLTSFLYYSFCLLYLPIRWWRKHTFDFSKVRSVLILALNQGVGTITLLTPMLKSLKRNRPDLRVTILTAPRVVEELLSGADYIDEIITEEKLLPAGLREGVSFFRREIAPREFDLVISTFYDISDKLPLWKFFSGAPYRFGYKGGIVSLLDTFTLSWEEKTHEVQRHLDILRFLGLSDMDEELSLPITDSDRCFAAQFLASRDIEEGALILGIHPGAKADWPEKRWPLERFVAVAQDFSAKHGAKVIFFGGPDDRGECAQLSSLGGDYILAHRQTIRETAALISSCKLFLCNDSGLMHVAAAMKVPIVTVFGPTRPTKNRPWGVPYILMRKELPCSPCYDYGSIHCTEQHECMSLMSAEEVKDALERLLLGLCEHAVPP